MTHMAEAKPAGSKVADTGQVTLAAEEAEKGEPKVRRKQNR